MKSWNSRFCCVSINLTGLRCPPPLSPQMAWSRSPAGSGLCGDRSVTGGPGCLDLSVILFAPLPPSRLHSVLELLALSQLWPKSFPPVTEGWRQGRCAGWGGMASTAPLAPIDMWGLSGQPWAQTGRCPQDHNILEQFNVVPNEVQIGAIYR